MVPQEIFVSHSSKDHRVVEPIVTTLRKHGLPTWFSTADILGAQQWHDEIGAALQRCDWFVLMLSPRSVVAPWVKRELLFALQDAKYEGHIVPVMLETCDLTQLSWTLSGFQQVDFTSGGDQPYRDLLRTWGKGLDPSLLPVP